MQIILSTKADGQTIASVTQWREPQYLMRGPRIFAAEPVSWAFIAALFITSFTQALGKRLGEGVGQGILEALGILKRDNDGDLKNYFEALAQRIVLEVRTIVYENELRREHANLANAFDTLERYLVSPRTRADDLPLLDNRSGEIYNQLATLGGSALPGLVGAASIRMAVAAERFRITTNKKDRKAEAEIAQQVIRDTMELIAARVADMSSSYDERVVGPYKTKVSIACERHPRVYTTIEGEEEVEVETDGEEEIEIVTEGVEDRGINPQQVAIVRGRGMACRIDGEKHEIALFDCDRRRPGNARVIERLCAETRRVFREDFEVRFQQPLEALQAEAEALLSEISKRVGEAVAAE